MDQFFDFIFVADHLQAKSDIQAAQFSEGFAQIAVDDDIFV
jgi:hypothetical protein